MKAKALKGDLFNGQVLTISEAAISKQIADYLNRRGIFNIRINSGMVRVLNFANQISWMHLAPKGTPDRLVVYKSWCVFIEVKKKGMKPTPEQLAMHKRIREGGGIVIVAYSIDDVISVLKSIDNLPA